MTTHVSLLKIACLIGVMSFFAACNPQITPNETTSAVNKDSLSKEIELPASLEKSAKQVLLHLKNNDFQALSKWIHPEKGVIFVPYGYIDTAHHKHFSPETWKALIRDTTQVLQWGRFDGSGDPISLTWNDYHQRFVYDVDFLNAPDFTLNQLASKSSSPNNIDSIFPGSRFTESHFPGVDPQYGGIDWKALRLVFISENNKFYLVAVVHDQWTI